MATAVREHIQAFRHRLGRQRAQAGRREQSHGHADKSERVQAAQLVAVEHIHSNAQNDRPVARPHRSLRVLSRQTVGQQVLHTSPERDDHRESNHTRVHRQRVQGVQGDARLPSISVRGTRRQGLTVRDDRCASQGSRAAERTGAAAHQVDAHLRRHARAHASLRQSNLHRHSSIQVNPHNIQKITIHFSSFF